MSDDYPAAGRAATAMREDNAGASSPRTPAAAIIGAACRFPHADTVDEYWALLTEGRAIAAEPSAERLDLWAAAHDATLASRITTLKGGYLRDIAGFDADYFGIAPREAAKLDPQQRLLLTVTHDALEDAGITRATLQGLTVGVFVGAGSNDYMMLGSRRHDTIDSYHGIGNSHSILANRISYRYNLRGPSLTVDTACSSSLTALHVALQALAHDGIDLAIVGGVNVIVSPDLTLAFSQAGMLSPSGRCNTFSANADGYGRAEGAGVLVLARPGHPALAHARTRCLILASAINQDGRSNGITAPNGVSQREVIDTAMNVAGVSLADIAYVETHGTGTKLGDAIEFNALRDLFAKDPAAHCHVGSAKANVGHMEAAAGMGGLIKAMLMLEHGTIVPHAVKPPYNEFIDEARGQLAIAQSAVPLRQDGCIGVSSFGFGGSNAHVIVARAQACPDLSESDEHSAALLLLSSHDPERLSADALRLADHLESTKPPLSGVSATLAHRRDALRHRRAIVATDHIDAVVRLRESSASPTQRAHRPSGTPPRMAFVFTGQGSQYPGMGTHLYAANPTFRAAFDECAARIHHHANLGVDDLLGGGEQLFDDTHLAQLALFCLEYALARLLIGAGIEPAAVIGHSIGELVAQTVAGMLDLDDAVALVHERSRLMQAHGPAGAMIGVFATVAEMRELAASSGLPVHIAAINGATAVTMSGERAAIESLTSVLAARGIQARALRSRHAFHTPGLEEAARRLADYTRTLAVHRSRIPIASNLDGALLDTLPPGSDYWSRHIVAPVAFAQGIATLVAEKIDIFVEIGPDRQLSQLISRDYRKTGIEAVSIQRRDGNGLTDYLAALGRLFECHVDFDASSTIPLTPHVHLPARSLSNDRLWGFDPPTSLSSAQSALSQSDARPSMPVPRNPEVTIMSDANHADETIARIVALITNELAHSLGQAAERIDPHCAFVDMGADSLILAETLQDINRRYKVTLSVGEMYESVNTIAKVGRYLYEQGQYAAVLEARAQAQQANTASGDAAVSSLRSAGPAGPAVAASPVAPKQDATRADTSDLQQIVRKQLELMEQQLALLSSMPDTKSSPEGDALGSAALQAEVAQPVAATSTPSAVPPAAAISDTDHGVREAAVQPHNDRFSAFSVRLDTDRRKDDVRQAAHIASLAQRHNSRTKTSKDLAQTYRRPLADNRVSAGFRPLLKEIVYPVLAEQAEGAHIVDVDGNRYIDFTMGFGVHLFGHTPPFIVERLRAQLNRGMPIGPQSPMAGRVAELIAELTGHERVVFCNSGTEATMTAIRLARLAAGRDKIVIFKNAYHGSFDGFLARSATDGSTRPASLGTPDSFVADTIVLDYCEQASLDYIAAHRGEIGVVMVEPVQSRAPSLQPGTFLAQLRDLTRAHGIVLVFDEVISGFRCARGGAQEYFGVRADLCTYGKIVGGGMPIGIVAGAASVMDGIDGGQWQYGDESYPARPTIFFAGTFSKHPLTMAASLAVLEFLKNVDDAFYPRLNRTTRELAERLIAVFEEEGVDVTVEQFSSLFRFASKGNLDLFFYHLLADGIYIWEGRNCFISTAHTGEDIDRLVEAVRSVCQTLKPLGLIPLAQAQPIAMTNTVEPARRSSSDGPAGEPIALADAQQRFRAIELSSPDGRIANNVCFGFRFDSPIDAQRLAVAVEAALCAHDSLGARLNLASGTQTLGTANRFRLERFDHPDQLDETIGFELANIEQARPLPIEKGENVRAQLHTFAGGAALLTLSLHHVACDGWSLGVLLDEIAARYNGATPQPPLSYAAWMAHERDYRTSERYEADKGYWLETIDRALAYRARCPTAPVVHDNTIIARPGARASVTLERAVTEAAIAQAKRRGVTTFTWLLSCVQLFLSRIYGGRSPIIGLPFANRTARLKGLVGNCVNLPFVIPAQGEGLDFEAVLAFTREATMKLMNHSRFPYREACELYRARGANDNASPVEITFNVEPITRMPAFGETAPALVAPINQSIEFDLMFNVFLLSDGARIELDYNRDLVTADVAYGWLYLLAKLIENEASALRLAELSI